MISIIIPVYNAQNSISRCLNSILNNSFNDVEIIAINDGSSDDSWKILQEYEKNNSGKIRIFNQENQGVAITRNRGIGYAEGEFIMFIDNDDYVDKDYIASFVSKIEDFGSDIVIGGYRRTDGKKTLFEIKLQNVSWSKYMIMAPWAKIYRRKFLLEKKLEFLNNNIGEDVYFNLQVINLTNKIKIINYCGYNWFFNKKSVSNSSQREMKNELNIIFLLDSCWNKLKKIGVSDKEDVEFYFLRYVIWYLLFSGKKSSYFELCREFKKTFKWLKEKYPNFEKNKNVSLFFPVGEAFKNRIVVYFFMQLYHFRLIKFFFKIYAN